MYHIFPGSNLISMATHSPFSVSSTSKWVMVSRWLAVSMSPSNKLLLLVQAGNFIFGLFLISSFLLCVGASIHFMVIINDWIGFSDYLLWFLLGVNRMLPIIIQDSPIGT